MITQKSESYTLRHCYLTNFVIQSNPIFSPYKLLIWKVQSAQQKFSSIESCAVADHARILSFVKAPVDFIKGAVASKVGHNVVFFFYWRKVIFRVWLITCQKIRSLRARELPQNGGLCIYYRYSFIHFVKTLRAFLSAPK